VEIIGLLFIFGIHPIHTAKFDFSNNNQSSLYQNQILHFHSSIIKSYLLPLKRIGTNFYFRMTHVITLTCYATPAKHPAACADSPTASHPRPSTRFELNPHIYT
jgi:hypothetical protein